VRLFKLLAEKEYYRLFYGKADGFLVELVDVSQKFLYPAKFASKSTNYAKTTFKWFFLL